MTTTAKKPVKRKPAPHKPAAKPKARLTPEQAAVKELYPKEKSPYKAIPQNRRGPGRVTGGPTITIQAWALNLSVTCLLGAEGGKLTGGFGNWEAIAVPRGDPLTQWTGRSLKTMDLDLMVDAWSRGKSVEPQIAAIENLASRVPATLTPPALRLFGAVPYPNLKWVITGIDWGDQLRSSATGQRLRQELTLHLLEYREETQLASLPRAKAAPKPPRKYKVKRGDDLKKIATRQLGKSSRWPDIVKLNKGLRGWKLASSWIGKTIKVPGQ